MPRLPRYLLAGQPQHVIQRGNNRQPVFFEDADYWFFLECLQEGMRRWPCDLHAYVLMTNHVHLLLTPQAPDALSKLMQSVGRRYVQYINFAYARSGGLWEGRFRATPVNSDEYLLLCYRYIELNPVRAHMVDHPRRYRWSSYRYHAEGRPDPLVSDHPQFLALGNDAQERSMAYRALFTEDLDEATLERMRHSVHGGWALGNDRFRSEIEVATQRRAIPQQRGGKRFGAGRKRSTDRVE